MDFSGLSENREEKAKEWKEKLDGKYLIIDCESLVPSNYDKATALQAKPELQVLLSSLPEPRRVLGPGVPVTRDLRLNRLNVTIDSTGLIKNVSFF
ncbi:hypothetical protein AX774_g3330 [Zancudomyces culisetae]|uniref:Uncharacterized protein n=1 Tax=Zancudomyces culisetae TaxID=1213189 RepID=A0A1R1PQE2_ZANCU|nr:hypothetical protein AX774_g7314 [Zancudomyces culisetae]OMH83169.1 hypothetical protein AX774_g3330 [Zancudomyces culisetae]|eukprot:OMH79281.1 hypothetical protein AX774_g7314 [Zancudomyces culisetae]